MAYATLSTYDEVLKTYYLPAIQDYLNQDAILARHIEVNEEDVSGKNATIETHYGRSSGTGARADGGTLPTANYQKFKTCTVPMRYQYGRVSFTGPTIAATRDEKGAYARVVDTEITGIVKDLRKEINRQYWGCGYGIVARWSSGSTTSATATVYVQKAYRGNAAEPAGAFGSTFGAKYIEENGALGLADITFSSNVVTVIAIDASMETAVTVTDRTTSKTQDSFTNDDASANAAIAGDFFIRPSNLVAVAAVAATTLDDARVEMMGLRGIVTDTDIDDIAFSDGTGTGFTSTYTDPLQGLAIGSYPWFKAIVDSHASGRYGGQRALTLNMMQKMFDKVEEKAGEGEGPDMILTTRAIRREYIDLCLADRRTVNTMEIDGGVTAIDYNGIPFTVDNDAIDGEIYFLTLKDIQLYRMSDYDWMTKDGSILSRISNADAYEAVLFRYAELGVKKRNTQGVITDLAYSD